MKSLLERIDTRVLIDELRKRTGDIDAFVIAFYSSDDFDEVKNIQTYLKGEHTFIAKLLNICTEELNDRVECEMEMDIDD